ncbi:BRO-N domain-containing protein [Methylobacterium platani]|jgi:hypothetical protein|uniref:Bro-N domain-containing protein n=1 Tax=Methylobacterium platani TaxID=427683 RepID=A0A179S8V3_9HYPH|nr:BRO family protein [Methylobacterium platani]OAS23953.1 hypothetical protein A5481_16025 [Methylobacterium platani]
MLTEALVIAALALALAGAIPRAKPRPGRRRRRRPRPSGDAGPSSTFLFDGHPIRVVTMGGEPLFVASDVCEAIELRDVSDAVAKLDDDEKGRASVPTPGGLQSLLVVTESGLFTMVLRCRGAITPGTTPHRFRRWVTSEVLPCIRKTGAYAVPAAPVGIPAINVRDPAQLQAITLQLI